MEAPVGHHETCRFIVFDRYLFLSGPVLIISHRTNDGYFEHVEQPVMEFTGFYKSRFKDVI